VQRYLTTALLCEGREDERFFSALIERQVRELSLLDPGFGSGAVELQPCRTTWAADRVDAAVFEAAAAFDIVFMHNDYNERGKIDALRTRLADTLPEQTRLVAVVPIRETEAWLLTDPEALPRGGSRDALPTSPRNVESIADPKKPLAAALGHPLDVASAEYLGENISLERLAEVPAYRSFLQDLTAALKELNFL
jgi:Domain of unknown function (DUF4276)